MTASERTHVDAAAFRSALRHLAGGVTVVTAAGPDGPVGLTVTSLTAASLVPPLVSFYVDRDSGSLPAPRAGRSGRGADPHRRPGAPGVHAGADPPGRRPRPVRRGGAPHRCGRG